VAAAVLGAAAVLVIGTFVALEVRSVVAGPDAGAPAAAPTPVGHEWSQVEGHGTDGAGWWLGTTISQALELRVNNARALRLEPNTVSPNVIGGYSGNAVTAGAYGAAICGGGASGNTNRVTDNYGTVGGGYNNQAGDNAGTTSDRRYATVGGGTYNTASNIYASVGGGTNNTASGVYATVGGGIWNTASGLDASVGGGYNNFATADYSAVCGGWENLATDDYGAVGGGKFNQAGDNTPPSTDKTYATVGGGYDNTASGQYATVGGGYGDIASGGSATVGGGYTNTASATEATVGGGGGNLASAVYATVGGGQNNTASADYATIAGGGRSDPGNAATSNRVTDNYGTVGGGGNNQAGDAAGTTADRAYATVGGGSGNTADGMFSTVAGGEHNTASGQSATVGGGWSNAASGHSSTVGGGNDNTASGSDATVGGGRGNTASGFLATVPGGVMNIAAGDYSFAAGWQAHANNDGCFVWGDSTPAEVDCNTDNRFIARASGGLEFYSRSDLGTYCKLPAGSGSWSCSSSRDLKENFTPVDGQEVLASVAEIPITTWNYKAQDAATRHMGPVAQDFFAAFGLGESETSISTADADGVALAAIQGLYQLSQEQAARIQALEEERASGGPLSSSLSPAWLLLGGLFVAGLVVVQRRRAGGRR
jgi:hypothetical protein